MREYQGNMFNLLGKVEVICITTNGFVKSNGRAVMGAGCAKTARGTFKDIDLRLGKLIKANGNIPQVLGTRNYITVDGVQAPAPQTTTIVSFPTKHNWSETADQELIRKSAIYLTYLANKNGWKNVYLPRPGVGNGKLPWESDLTVNGKVIKAVKPILEQYLDNRFVICSFPERRTEVVVLEQCEIDTECTDTRDRYKEQAVDLGYTDTSVGRTPQEDGLTRWLNKELRVGNKVTTIGDVQAVCKYWAEFKCENKGHCDKCQIVKEYNWKYLQSKEGAAQVAASIEVNKEEAFKKATTITPKQKFMAVLKRYKKMTVKELKQRAKDGGLKGYSTLRKKELVKLIMGSDRMKNYILQKVK